MYMWVDGFWTETTQAISYNGAKRQLASSCISVRPSIRMEQLASHWRDLVESWYMFFSKVCWENSSFCVLMINSFIHLLIHSFVYTFIQPLIRHLNIHPFILSFICDERYVCEVQSVQVTGKVHNSKKHCARHKCMWGSQGIPPLILYLDTRWRRVAS